MRIVIQVAIIYFLMVQAQAQTMFQPEVYASKWRLNFGVRDSFVKMTDETVADYEYPHTFNYNVGMLRDFSISKRWRVRQGISFNQRSGVVRAGGVLSDELEIKARFIEFPLQLVRRVQERIFIYTGPVIGIRATTDCKFGDGTWCTLKNEASYIMPWQTGVEFPVSHRFNFGIYFESGPGKYSNEIEMQSGFGVQFTFPATSIETTEYVEDQLGL